MYVDSFIGAPINGITDLGFATINYNLNAAGADISDEKFHTVTKLALSCRSTITGISHDQENGLVAAANIDDVKADKFTGGAEKMDCYLGITNVFAEWYQGVVAADKAAHAGLATNTLEKQFKKEVLPNDRRKAGKFDLETKKVGLVIADTGDVVLNSAESHALFYSAPDNDDAAQATKWGAFINQGGVETTYGTLTFKFVAPFVD